MSKYLDKDKVTQLTMSLHLGMGLSVEDYRLVYEYIGRLESMVEQASDEDIYGSEGWERVMFGE